MSILAKNLKTIRKELGCSQSVMSEILTVGCRSFVRYEAGARDAPLSVLVKIARLGNISLEQLLTSEVKKNDFFPLQEVNRDLSSTDLSLVDFKEGYVVLNNPSRQEFITLNVNERKVLMLFRKMDPCVQNDFLCNLGEIVGAEKITSKLMFKA